MKKLKELGITLIALVVTIIILLILAGVTLSIALKDGGLIEKAREGVAEYEIAGENEEDTLEEATKMIQNLIDEYTGEGTGFDEKNITIGNATRVEDYGKKVKEYNVQTDEYTSGEWRLFYQDINYTYLIADSYFGEYDFIEISEEYTDGSKVSTIGQRLNKQSADKGFFTKDNTSKSAKEIAWLTDTTKWADYAKGDALYAIGGPTIELFTASFNATHSDRPIELSVTDYGDYIYDCGGEFFAPSMNNGIYSHGYNTNSSFWLIASGDAGANDSLATMCERKVLGPAALEGCLRPYDDLYKGYNPSVRPVVCIKTPVFDEKYTLE